MKANTKSSITLPAGELEVVERLKKRLGTRSKVEVIRRALDLLSRTTSREDLRQAYREASKAVRGSSRHELEELDHLSAEGLDD
jgi:hypothetical protein